MSIKLAHRKLEPVIGAKEIEPLRAAEEVERLRLDWKPRRVRVVLLAESHVWTSEEELQIGVRVNNQPQRAFVRFVYCLGYGEQSVLTRKVSRNSGTWQYWRLFHDSVSDPAEQSGYKRVLKSGCRIDEERIQAKLDLLHAMKDRGIWLVDASITALYRTGRPKLAAGRNYEEALNLSWDYHVGPAIRECNPQKIVVVGKSVMAALSGRITETLPKTKVCQISQPNAYLSRPERQIERERCYKFCR